MNRFEVKENFLEFYRSLGFDKIDPEALIPQKNKTTAFTGSVSTKFLHSVIQGADAFPLKGEVMVQPCLRLKYTKNLKDDPDYNPAFMTYFEMLGASISPQYYDIKKVTCDFLTEEMGFKKEELVVHAPSTDKFFHNGYGEGIKIEIDNHEDSYYQWVYGNDALSGVGITLSVHKPEAGYSLDMGNIIEIRKNGQPIGYEVAFGVEAILAGKNDDTNLFNYNVLSETCSLEYNNPGIKRATDIFIAATAIGTSGIRYNPGKKVKSGCHDSYRNLLALMLKSYQNNDSNVTKKHLDDILQNSISYFENKSNIMEQLNSFAKNQKTDLIF